MHDDALLQKELAKIKKAVKDNFRRTKRLHAKRIADEESSARESSQDDLTVDHTADATTITFTTSDSLVSQEASYRESELAAYYLDYLFPVLVSILQMRPSQWRTRLALLAAIAQSAIEKSRTFCGCSASESQLPT
jgi:hypothetical protein